MTECFKPTISSCKYSVHKDSWIRGDMNVHRSYDFLLTMSEIVSCANKILIHCQVQEVERKYLAPFLKAKRTQTFSATRWQQTVRPSKEFRTWHKFCFRSILFWFVAHKKIIPTTKEGF